MKRLLVLVNPDSGRGEASLSPALDVWRKLGIHTEVVRLDDGAPAGLAGSSGAWDARVVVGGDGTLNRIAPALVGSDTPLGILPAGTANDFATSLGIPRDPEAAARVIADGHCLSADVGSANGRTYLNVASVGLAAEVTRALAAGHKRWLGPLSYPLTALRLWREQQGFRVRIVCEAGRYRVRTRQLSIANGPRQGGYLLDPEGSVTSGRLTLYSLAPQPWWRLLLVLPALRRRREPQPGLLLLRDQRRIEVRTHRPRPVTADGEIITHTPLRAEVHPRALRVLVPRPEA